MTFTIFSPAYKQRIVEARHSGYQMPERARTSPDVVGSESTGRDARSVPSRPSRNRSVRTIRGEPTASTRSRRADDANANYSQPRARPTETVSQPRQTEWVDSV